MSSDLCRTTINGNLGSTPASLSHSTEYKLRASVICMFFVYVCVKRKECLWSCVTKKHLNSQGTFWTVICVLSISSQYVVYAFNWFTRWLKQSKFTFSRAPFGLCMGIVPCILFKCSLDIIIWCNSVEFVHFCYVMLIALDIRAFSMFIQSNCSIRNLHAVNPAVCGCLRYQTTLLERNATKLFEVKANENVHDAEIFLVHA